MHSSFDYQGFIHLRSHSSYSLTEGAIVLKRLLSLCHDHQMPAIALTDTNNLFGALEFSMEAHEKGIQPIIGCDLSILVPGIDQTVKSIVLLVQNDVGYKNLMKLISDAYFKENTFLGPHITFDDLKHYHEGLICLSGGAQGPIGYLFEQALQKGTSHQEAALALLQDFHTLFQDRFYMELQRHDLAQERQVESFFLNQALTYHIPIVATNNVFFETPESHEAHDALLCIAEGKYVYDAKRRLETPLHYFRSTEEMQQAFHDLPEAIDNTVVIAKRCAFRPQTHSPILPRFPTINASHEDEEIVIQAKDGLEKRLQEEVYPLHPQETHLTIRQLYEDRLLYELNVIKTMGFSGYFLIVADFIQWAKSKHIPGGPGRGSGAGSLVAWVLTITDMDPIRFNLIFERFLNPERVSMPDFDVDFCQYRRDEVIAYVAERYGKDRVAHIITFGKFQARMVVRDVGRVLQIPYGQVDKLCKLIPNNPANPVTLAQAIEGEPQLQTQRLQDPIVDKLMTIGMQLEGLYRHASTHAAGIVIGDRPLHEIVPLYRDEKSDLAVTQFSMKYVEAAGLVKFDFLGLKTLTVIEACSELIRKNHQIPFKIQTIPLDDPKTFELLCRVESVGIFQLESGGMRDVLRKLQPDRFEDLIALVALYRPGPMDDIPRYLACKHGLEPVTYAHPSLEPILKTTYGVMVYQEQVMQIAQSLGGYTLGAADLLRRAMGKKIKAEMDAQRTLFTSGAIQNGIPSEVASHIFDLMAKFAGYGFNKSHSAPYALLAYQTAYLKANFPFEFFCASMTLDMQNTDKLKVFKQDLERLDIMLLKPDINHSFATFVVENLDDGKKAIRYALSAIKNVGQQAMEQLVENRRINGEFKSLEDFASRIDPRVINKRQMDKLVAAGAFDTLMEKQYGTINRRQFFEHIDSILQSSHTLKAQKNSKQRTLFSNQVQQQIQAITLKPTLEWTPLEKLQHEFDALGFYLSAHPLDVYKDVLKTLQVVSSSQFLETASESFTTVNLVGIVLSKQERTSKKGEKYAFVQMTDLSGFFEVMFFQEAYTTYRDEFVAGSALYITASLKLDGEETYRLLGKTVESLDGKNAVKNYELTVTAEKCHIDLLKNTLLNLKQGRTKLDLLIMLEDQNILRFSLPGAFEITENVKAVLGQFA